MKIDSASSNADKRFILKPAIKKTIVLFYKSMKETTTKTNILSKNDERKKNKNNFGKYSVAEPDRFPFARITFNVGAG